MPDYDNKKRKYLSKDFIGLRDELINHARLYFPKNMQDFSEASLGGLFLEMAAYVGDNMSYYLDHQFNELNYETAVESVNIERHLRTAGVKITGDSPATMIVKFYIEVPAELQVDGSYGPKTSALPLIQKGTVVTTTAGVDFELAHDINYSATDPNGKYIATVISGNRRGNVPTSFYMYAFGLCVSGRTVSESFVIPNEDLKFRTITLRNPSVSSIDRVYDSDGNDYYEVESLSQDTVFRAVSNPNFTRDNVPMNIQAISARRRFVTETSIATRTTSLKFGSGKPTAIDNDIVPDPSNMALPLYGRTNIKKFSIDPNSILDTATLGVYPKNTTITVSYRYGGGSSHNVVANSANGIANLKMVFQDSVNLDDRRLITNSIDVENESPASGGDDAPTVDELRAVIPASRNMQNRIVTKEDLLARIYTLPAEFGRVFRASILPNPNNPMSTSLHILSRDSAGNLTQSPDALKQNMATYLNEFRLISNSIDILDAEIINYRVVVNIVVKTGTNPNDVANNIINSLTDLLALGNYQLGQNIVEADIISTVLGAPGVQALDTLTLVNRTGTVADRTYSGKQYSFSANRVNGVYAIPQNAIFELKYPNFDITVNV